jgi:hypothetical protein
MLAQRGKARVDALDGRIGPVGIDFDDEFKPIVGHWMHIAPIESYR